MSGKDIRKLKKELKNTKLALEIYETYTDQIVFTEEDIVKLNQIT